MGRLSSAGRAATRRKPVKDSRSASAAIMFWGLPIRVAAEPVLAAKQKPSRKGAGFSPRARVIETRTGVIATTTTSLVSSADNPPATPISTASRAGGETRRPPTARAARS